jgi:hypothetical protein
MGYTKPAVFSAMLMPNETIIGQSHFNRRRTRGRGIFQVEGRNYLSPSLQGRGELFSFCAMACTRPVENSAMLVPDGKIIGQLHFKLRRKSGEPLSQFGDAIRGFRGFGVAADFLQSLQGPSAAFCQSPGHAKNNFNPRGAAGTRKICAQSFWRISFGSRLDLRGRRLLAKWGDKMF